MSPPSRPWQRSPSGTRSMRWSTRTTLGTACGASSLSRTWPVYTPCALEEERSTKTKEWRIIDTLEPVLAQHRLVVDPEVIKNDFESTKGYEGEMRRAKTLIFQMTRMTKIKGALRKDDRIDALAGLVARFTEIMNQDDQKREAEERSEQMRLELQRHIGVALGGAPRNPKWTKV